MAGVREAREIVVPQQVTEGAGVRLRRSIGTRTLDSVDPFLLLDHFGSEDPADYRAGFPTHPHRGMETVTYMLAGRMRHRDTSGNEGVVGPGGVQWMTAGAGLQHEEMPEPVDGRLEGLQLWVNLPSAHKRIPPRHRSIPAEEIPLVARGGATIRVIAGDVGGSRGPVRELIVPTRYLDVTLPAGESITLEAPQGHAAIAYLLRGGASFGPPGGEREADVAPRLVLFGEGDSVRVAAGGGGARFLLISAPPLDEPVARYGPFVMNTQEEIQEALADLRRGTFEWRP